uniref:Metalloendopeptidase n=1 Tax=Strongyloides venezuelensis TaxID=75913 RepID=A0A0K0FPU6_STRVS
MYIYKDSNTIYKRDILEFDKKMWTFPIKYKIGDSLNNNVIKLALKEIENNTCIRFKEDNSLNTNTEGLFFERSKFCSSYVGLVFTDKKQTVNLTYECSSGIGFVLHEVGHALGLLHEHTRTDRDKFVTINEDNIKEGLENNFKIPNGTWYKNYSTYYDYGSVMGYNPYEVAKSRQKKVLSSKINTEYDRMMGQRSYMTFNDLKKINLRYCYNKNKTQETEEEKKRKGSCQNSGYVHYNGNDSCICPFGYTGKLCSEIMKSDERCNTTTFYANNTLFTHWIAGPYKCFFHIKANEGKKVQFGIYMSNAPSNEICTQDTSHQVKHFKDKGSTGLLLCSFRREIINITSESNTVLIFFNGNENNALLQFGFREVS